MDRQKETQELRAWLISVKSKPYAIAKISERAMVVPKTLYAIINDPNKVAQASTIKALQSARKWWEKNHP
jgi:hypothetical protein